MLAPYPPHSLMDPDAPRPDDRPDPDGLPWPDPRGLVLLAATVEGGLVVVAAVLGWLVDQAPMAKIEWTVQGAALGAAASLPPLGLLLLCVNYPVWPWAGVVRVADEVLAPLFRRCTVTELAMISLLAGLGEEMLFRGVLQDAGAQRIGGAHGPWLALVGVNVLFGLLHWITPFYAVLAGLIGVYLGWLWIATGNLLVPIAAHAVYDFLALVYLAKIRPARGAAGGP